MSHQFRRFDDEELRIASFDLLLRRPLLHLAPTASQSRELDVMSSR
jgi:hypothetical protein